jgi:hypothetical protein
MEGYYSSPLLISPTPSFKDGILFLLNSSKDIVSYCSVECLLYPLPWALICIYSTVSESRGLSVKVVKCLFSNRTYFLQLNQIQKPILQQIKAQLLRLEQAEGRKAALAASMGRRCGREEHDPGMVNLGPISSL